MPAAATPCQLAVKCQRTAVLETSESPFNVPRGRIQNHCDYNMILRFTEESGGAVAAGEHLSKPTRWSFLATATRYLL